MKLKKSLGFIPLLLVLLFLATPALACMNCWNGGWGYQGRYRTNTISPEQQQQLDALRQKYGLDTLGEEINAAAAKLNNARANDATTVGQLRQLENQIATLQAQYRQAMQQANAEAVSTLGQPGPWFYGPGYGHTGSRGYRYVDNWGGPGCWW